jgi:hypothetical protein
MSSHPDIGFGTLGERLGSIESTQKRRRLGPRGRRYREVCARERSSRDLGGMRDCGFLCFGMKYGYFLVFAIEMARARSEAIFVGYPLIPWIGVTAIGYSLGQVYAWSSERRGSFLLRTGLGATAGFVISEPGSHCHGGCETDFVPSD